MALVGFLVPAGRRDSHQVEAKGTSPRGVYFLGAGNWRQKELAQEPEPNASDKKQWAQGPIWILVFGRWRVEEYLRCHALGKVVWRVRCWVDEDAMWCLGEKNKMGRKVPVKWGEEFF
jgi:hypothetical protein